MTLTEKMAYIRGLAEGLNLDETKDEVKVLKAMMELLDDTMAAERLVNPTVWVVNASGESRFEAEDYTYKQGYARPEKSGTRTLMSYVRATGMHVPYLTYTLNVKEAGAYILSASYANASADSNANSLRVFVNGVEQFANYNATSTGGWSKVADNEIGI